MIQYGGDVSNFTEPLTPQQLAFVNANWQRACIGLQNGTIARRQQGEFSQLAREYYMERPNRDLSIPEAGAWVWADVEDGCLVTKAELDQSIALIRARGLRPCIYGNETSIKPVIGESTEYADAGIELVYANYGTPDFSRFKPFNGWTKCRAIQYSSGGVAGINCDLDMWEVMEEDVQEHYPNELNERRARELLTFWENQVPPVIKASFDPQGRGLLLTGSDGQPVLVPCPIPEWAAPS